MIPALAVPGTTKGPYAYVSAHKVHILARTKPKKKCKLPMTVNLAEGHQKPSLCAHQDLKVPWGNIHWASGKALAW